MLRFSTRALELQSSPIRKLNSIASSAKKQGKKIYHLNIGQPDIPTPNVFFDAIKEYEPKIIKYVDSQGIPQVIDSFRKYYNELGINFDHDEIMITNGGSEAVFFAIMSVCDYGDEIIVPEPFYANYNSFAEISGVNIVPFLTKAEEGFHLPQRDLIVRHISKKTKAIMISNPGNPTGVVYSKEELKTLAEIALEYDLFIISDEVYREFIYDGLKFTSFFEIGGIEDRVILVDSISKRYSACGARIGNIASKNKELMALILKFCQSRLCAPLLEQIGASALIDTPKKYFDETLMEYEARRDVVYNALKNMPGVVCEKPSGAFYIIAKLPVKNAEELTKFLLTEYHINNETVMLAPAQGFYLSEGLGVDEVRIAYCLNCDDLKKAMNILSNGILEFNKR